MFSQGGTLSIQHRTTLTQEFWPQSHLTVVESDTMFINNRNIQEEFAIDKYYVGLAHNQVALSFRMGVDCHKGYVVLVRVEDKEHPEPIWLVRALSSPNFVRTSPNFRQIKVEYCRSSTKDQNFFRTYLGWDIKKSFKWIVD